MATKKKPTTEPTINLKRNTTGKVNGNYAKRSIS